MASYSSTERMNMIIAFRESGKKARPAVRIYRERYPNSRHPDHKCILRVWKTFEETGVAERRKPAGRPRAVQHVQRETDLLAYVNAHPHVGSREMAELSGLSKSTVLRLLHKHNFHDYRLHNHQALTASDPPHRLDFANWALSSFDSDPTLQSHILWSDESTFTRDGTSNTHNKHHWAQRNPFHVRAQHHQVRWQTNVWCGILGTRIVGPYFLPDNLNGPSYLSFLRDTLSEDLDNFPLAETMSLWFQQDGAPPHYHSDVRRWLNTNFPDRWIGRGGPIHWPTRSPDMTPLDFYLWGRLKQQIYVTEPPNVEELQQRIRVACASITEQELASVQNNIVKRFQACIVVDGHHFEQVLS